MATGTDPAGTHSFIKGVGRSESRVTPVSFRIAGYLLVVSLVAAPLAFGSVEIWAWASLAVIAAILLILWAIGCLEHGVVAVHWTVLYIPAILFLLLGICQLAGHFTLDPFGTQEALIELATDLVFFFLAGQLWVEASGRTRKRFGLAVAVYAAAMALFAIVQFFTSHALLYWTIRTQGYAVGPYVNHNDYAGLMEMLIPIALCYALSRPLGDLGRRLLLFGVCVAAVSVLLSGSRGGVISVMVEIAILGIFLWRLKKIRLGNKRRSAGLVGAAVAAAIFLVLIPASSWQRMATIAGVATKPDATLENRLLVSRDALTAVRDSPWLGTGLGTFKPVFPQYESFPTQLVWHHAHDDYVEGLMETGAVGGVLMVSALLLFLRRAFSKLPERLKTAGGWLQLGATLGCCGLLVHSFADFNLHIPANAAWFAVCAGISVMPRRRPVADPE